MRIIAVGRPAIRSTVRVDNRRDRDPTLGRRHIIPKIGRRIPPSRVIIERDQNAERLTGGRGRRRGWEWRWRCCSGWSRRRWGGCTTQRATIKPPSLEIKVLLQEVKVPGVCLGAENLLIAGVLNAEDRFIGGDKGQQRLAFVILETLLV